MTSKRKKSTLNQPSIKYNNQREKTMKYIFLLSLLLLTSPIMAQDYPSSEKDAVYLATLKAVLDYKMNDTENIKQLDKLRKDEKFNQKLQEMLEDLDNKKRSSRKDKRVYELLIRAGKNVYNVLD